MTDINQTSDAWADADSAVAPLTALIAWAFPAVARANAAQARREQSERTRREEAEQAAARLDSEAAHEGRRLAISAVRRDLSEVQELLPPESWSGIASHGSEVGAVASLGAGAWLLSRRRGTPRFLLLRPCRCGAYVEQAVDDTIGLAVALAGPDARANFCTDRAEEPF